MLFLAKKDSEQFYINPEDAKQYAYKGYEIIETKTERCLTLKEIAELNPVVIEVNLK